MEFAIHVEGPRACFRRPEMREDFVSYDVLTPLAATQLISRLIDRSACSVRVTCITVLKPIRFGWFSLSDHSDPARRINALIDVGYTIHASIDADRASEQPPIVMSEGMDEAVAERLFLGLRDCPVKGVKMLVPGERYPSPLSGTVDLGWMIYDLSASSGRGPRFFRASLTDGQLAVPHEERTDFAY